MAEVIQYVLIDPTIHQAVAADGVAREADYVTTYDDGTEGVTRHMLYVEDGEVRSCLLTEWPAVRGAGGAE